MGGLVTPEIVTIILFAYLVFTELRNWHERKNLMDRLFARDLPELVHLDIERKQASVKHKMPDPVRIEL